MSAAAATSGAGVPCPYTSKRSAGIDSRSRRTAEASSGRPFRSSDRLPAAVSGEPVSGGAALADGRIALIVDCDALGAFNPKAVAA